MRAILPILRFSGRGPALFAASCLALLPVRVHAQQHGHSDHDAEAAIRTLIQRTAEANNAGDVEAWVALFAEGAIYMPPNSPPVTTRDGLLEVARVGFRHRAAIRIEPLEIRVAGDWGFARNDVSGTVTLHGSGEVVTIDVKQIVVYQRQPDGAWKIARLISNSNRS